MVESIVSFRRILTRNIAYFLEVLLQKPFTLSFSELSRTSGISQRMVYLRLATLRRKAFKAVGVDINFSLIGFRWALVFARKNVPLERAHTSFLKMYIPLIPYGTVLVYLLPRICSSVFEKCFGEKPQIEPRDTVVFDGLFWIPAKHMFLEYWDFEQKQPKKNSFAKVLEKSKPTEPPAERDGKRVFVDPLDMEILAKLDAYSILPLKTIYRAVAENHKRLPYRTFYTHLRKHLVEQGVVRGFRSRLVPILEDKYLIVEIEARKKTYGYVQELMKHPCSVMTLAGKEKLFAFMVVPEEMYGEFFGTLETLGAEFRAYAAFRNRKKVFSTPYFIPELARNIRLMARRSSRHS